MRNLSFSLAAAGALLVALPQAMAIEKETVGNARVVVRTVTGTFEADLRRIKLLDDVYHNEFVETAEQSATEITFVDGTKLALGPNSSLTLDKFVYDPDPNRAAFVMTATAGVFRFVSGSMPKKAYTIHTPTATIGIRGTVFTVVIMPAAQAGGGNDVLVNVTVEQGVAEVAACGGPQLILGRLAASTTMHATKAGTCAQLGTPGPQAEPFKSLGANLASALDAASAPSETAP